MTAVPGQGVDIPIYTHERVLGADIRVHQLQDYCEMRGIRYPLAEASDTVEIHAVDGDPYLDQRDRTYIAAWARRTLFGGEGA